MTSTRPVTQPMADALAAIESRLPRAKAAAAVDRRSLRALEARGLVRPASRNAQQRPMTWTLTAAGALHILADLAGWTFPADAGDPYAVGVCAGAALKRAEVAGIPDDDALARVLALVAVARNLTATLAGNLIANEARP